MAKSKDQISRDELEERCALFDYELRRFGMNIADFIKEADKHFVAGLSSSTLYRFRKVAQRMKPSLHRNIDGLLKQLAHEQEIDPPKVSFLKLAYPTDDQRALDAAEADDDDAEEAEVHGEAGAQHQSSRERSLDAVPVRARRRWLRLVAVAALAVVGGVAVAALLAGGDEEPHQACDAAVGQTVSSMRLADREKVERLRDELLDLVPEGLCADDPTGYFADGLLQLLSDGAGPKGVLFVTPDDRTFYFTQATWDSYRQIIDGDLPEATARYAGYPVSAKEDLGAQVIELTEGGLLLSVNEDNQGFWIPREALESWRATGGVDGEVGLPTTNPYVDPNDAAFHQDYERGSARVLALAPERGPIEYTVASDRGALLRTVGEVRDHVLHQRGATTAWYVDERGKRRWIPDGDVYACVTAHAPTVDPLPGYEIWTLPLGPPMVCDS